MNRPVRHLPTGWNGLPDQKKDDQKIKAGSLATVTAISGVKLILRPVKEEKESWD